jgi:hypothetical protein
MEKIWERIIPLSKASRSWDIRFWQAQGARMRFRAAWQMTIDYYKRNNKECSADIFRLQRTVEKIKKVKWI